MKQLALFQLLAVFLVSNIYAQDGLSPISYKSFGLQFSEEINLGDGSTILPGFAHYSGYGSLIDNPAVMALAKENYYSLGFINSNYSQSDSYLGNALSNEFNKNLLSNLALVYSVPTTQGSLVIGGGYSLTSSFNSESAINARNNTSTITDAFKNPGSSYYDIAFDAFAIDYGDVEQTFLESIFRIGFAEGDYPGISQSGRIDVNRTAGEYNVFASSEVQKNVFAGVSLGLVSGRSDYTRAFLEFDEFNDYDGDFIGSDENGQGGTDIDEIYIDDEINSSMFAFSARAGLLYKLSNKINIAASLKLPSRIYVSENYYSAIETFFDDGTSTPLYDLNGQFDYSIKRPGQLNLGFAMQDISGFYVSAGVELIDYSTLSIDLTRSNDLSISDEVFLRERSAEINSEISNEFNSVANLKAGIAYKFQNALTLQAAYNHYPSRNSGFDVDKEVYSAGLEFRITEGIDLSLSTQYLNYQDRSELYFISDESGGSLNPKIDTEFDIIRFSAGLKFYF